ncbi:phosphate ABC transporter substrate-binding protein [Fictibacillus iocasae]|uniref:Phosphate ABC transporter substrate-binding protein n=1 Tax=Fictibacillus iocasae TaxID=2715437 RepID=A0ABW2NQY0_9BACL
MNWFKKLSLVTLTSAMVLGSVSFAPAQKAEAAVSGKISIMGSSALLPLSKQAAIEFKKKNPKVSITASGSSSIAGPQSVRKGIAQIGACDWDATKSKGGFSGFSGLVAHKVAIIPFATIVHPGVSVDSLTKSQLQGIFSGKYTNWKQVGGKDLEITVVNRAFGSGTRVNYQEKALGNASFKKTKNYVEVKSSGDMATKVKSTPGSIGYIDLVYVKSGLKALKFNGVSPTTSNVISGKYPVYGTGYYMTKGQPTGATKEFIKYVQSAKFQNGTLKKMKFIPISAMR